MSKKEEWKPIPGYERYLISSLGRVAKIHGEGHLRPDRSGRDGYPYKSVRLYESPGRVRKLLIHRLVYFTFHGDIPCGYQIDHIDRDTNNNALSNLRAVTPEENQLNKKRYAVRVDLTSYDDIGINI